MLTYALHEVQCMLAYNVAVHALMYFHAISFLNRCSIHLVSTSLIEIHAKLHIMFLLTHNNYHAEIPKCPTQLLDKAVVYANGDR